MINQAQAGNLAQYLYGALNGVKPIVVGRLVGGQPNAEALDSCKMNRGFGEAAGGPCWLMPTRVAQPIEGVQALGDCTSIDSHFFCPVRRWPASSQLEVPLLSFVARTLNGASGAPGRRSVTIFFARTPTAIWRKVAISGSTEKHGLRTLLENWSRTTTIKPFTSGFARQTRSRKWRWPFVMQSRQLRCCSN